MKTLKIFLFLIIGFFSIKCNDKIDTLPSDIYNVEIFYDDSVYVRQFVNNIYNSLPFGYNRLSKSMLACATDEAVQSSNSSPANDIAKGIWDAFSNPDNTWNTSYNGIRNSNIYLLKILPEIKQKTFRSQATLNALTGQVLFLRAMCYFELVKRFGGVPIVKEVLEASSSTNIPRNTYDECINFIVSQCDTAAALLPSSLGSTAMLGRITKGAAYSLKARTLLYAASPLFNDPNQPNDMYSHGAYSPTKWEKSASAAHDVIGLNIYSLHPNYGDFFTTLSGNKEVILSRMEAPSNTVEQDNGPSGYTGGNGGTGPSLNLVDDYAMKDGTQFDWNNSEMASNPFTNRDPRFYSSILCNGQVWMNDTIDTYIGGNDLGNVNSTKTSFYLRKFLSTNAKWFGVKGTTFHCWPIFRYGEILLNYAESMNEAYGPENDNGYGMTAKDAIELIRKRAGLVPFSINSGLSKTEMREIIRHERRIELAFEEHRHLDARRWKIAESTLGTPVYGLRIVKNPNGDFTYQKVLVEDRVFTSKMYLYPIPQSEIDRNPTLIQNPDW